MTRADFPEKIEVTNDLEEFVIFPVGDWHEESTLIATYRLEKVERVKVKKEYYREKIFGPIEDKT